MWLFRLLPILKCCRLVAGSNAAAWFATQMLLSRANVFHPVAVFASSGATDGHLAFLVQEHANDLTQMAYHIWSGGSSGF